MLYINIHVRTKLGQAISVFAFNISLIIFCHGIIIHRFGKVVNNYLHLIAFLKFFKVVREGERGRSAYNQVV